MTELSIFDFEGQKIRVSGSAERPEWVAADVGAVLGLEHPTLSRRVAKLPETWKGVYSIHTLGGQQQMLTVTEPGLYELIFRSDKPAAQRFRIWMFEEVLPSIRRTGSYSHSAPQQVLDPQISQLFGLWQGTGAATTQQMAEYYEVPVDAVESVLRRNRDELESDGLITLKGSQLKTFKQLSVKLTESNAGSMTVWTPRAALRLGMLLKDSEVAKQVRNVLLDVAQTAEPRDTGNVQREISQLIELAQTQVEVINEQQKMLAAALASLNRTKSKEKTQPKWTPRTTSHLMEFVREVGLEIQPGSQVYISDLWQQLQAWYIKTGVLKVEIVKGKEKLTWRDLPNKHDCPVKAINQISRRFREIFPQVQKQRCMERAALERRGCRYLTGIGYAQEVSETLGAE
jgi:prophage antirepressor-like protein